MAHLEKFSLKLSLVVRNPSQSAPVLNSYSFLVHYYLWCFFTLLKYYLDVSFDLKAMVFCSAKMTYYYLDPLDSDLSGG